MTIPKYVQEMMERSQYEFDFYKHRQGYAAGYTIRIRKATAYTRIDTLKGEIERLCKWADKIGGEGTAVVLDIPASTRYCSQAATITIFDPVMQHIERFIRS
jgi:hypothetical protein